MQGAGGLEDGSESWWAGAQQCFAKVALAAVLATTALSTGVAAKTADQPQDELPTTSTVSLDQDYWQNPVAPTYQYLPTVLSFPSEGSASVLAPDEDYWINPVAPVWKYPVVIFNAAQ